MVFFERLYKSVTTAGNECIDRPRNGGARSTLGLPKAWAQPAPQTLPTLSARRRSL
jgi:hypothetical protein